MKRKLKKRSLRDDNRPFERLLLYLSADFVRRSFATLWRMIASIVDDKVFVRSEALPDDVD